MVENWHETLVQLVHVSLFLKKIFFFSSFTTVGIEHRAV